MTEIALNVRDGGVSARLRVDSNGVKVPVKAEQVRVVDSEPLPPYEGEYRVTPSEEEQVLATRGRKMIDNVTVEPIPSNYGRIVWNGSTLTVY